MQYGNCIYVGVMAKIIANVFFLSIILLASCVGSGSAEDASGYVSLDSLERLNVNFRRPSSEHGYGKDVCKSGYASPILADNAPFASDGYSFVRTMPNEGYEMCRYDGHTVLEIAQYGCENYSFSVKWCYDDISAGATDEQITERALLNTKEIARWAGNAGLAMADAADFLNVYIEENGINYTTGVALDYYPPDYGYRHKVTMDTVRRYGNAACVAIEFSQGSSL